LLIKKPTTSSNHYGFAALKMITSMPVAVPVQVKPTNCKMAP
jgi:hypothetical protein